MFLQAKLFVLFHCWVVNENKECSFKILIKRIREDIKMKGGLEVGAFIISNERKSENDILRDVSKKKIAIVSEQNWKIEEDIPINDLKNKICQNERMDVLYMDVTREAGLETTEQFRRKNQDSALMIIADDSVSPMSYLRPAIRANSLLLRPFNEEMVKQVVDEIWDWYRDNVTESENFFQFDTSEAPVSINLDKIIYFESNNKKIQIHLQNETFYIYDTLDQLQQRLPEYFIRCHRGFIVNWKKIKRLQLSKGELVLENEVWVPVSRSYKPMIKELFKLYEGK